MFSQFAENCMLKGGFQAEIPPAVGKHVVLQGLDLYLTYGSVNPTFNAAFFLHVSESTAQSLLDAVEDFFLNENLPFSIVISPLLTPTPVQELLLNRGYRLDNTFSCMWTIPKPEEHYVPENSDFVIDLCNDIDTQIHLYSEAYPMPKRDATIMVKTMKELGFANYVAYDKKTREPAAIGTLCTFSDGVERIAYLGGAATLPSARGKGAYKALLQSRMRKASLQGCHLITVQANKNSSMKACLAAGFQEYAEVSYLTKR